MRKAIVNLEGEIAGALVGRGAAEQQEIDRLMCELDGTPGKSRLGANAILAASLASARAATSDADREVGALQGARSLADCKR